VSKATDARRQRQKEALRAQILGAARQLLQEEDFHNLSLRRIAERIEYSPTTIYLHFKDKNDLVLELILEGFEALRQRMLQAHRPDPVESLRQRALDYLAFGSENPQFYRLMFQLEDMELNALCQSQAERVSQGCFQLLLESVAELRASNQLALPYPDILCAHLLWGQLHGCMSLILGNLLEYLTPQQREQYRQAAVETLVASAVSTTQ
jgi:AcrR family transcriptional regulator